MNTQQKRKQLTLQSMEAQDVMNLTSDGVASELSPLVTINMDSMKAMMGPDPRVLVEESDDVHALPPEALLLRWVNFTLGRPMLATSQGELYNMHHYFADGTVCVPSLHFLNP